MFRKVLALVAVVLAFGVCDLQAGQTSCSWIGGEEGVWEDANNWSCGVVPDNKGLQTFAVTISGVVVVDLKESHVIDQLDCYENVNLGHGAALNWVEVGLSLEDSNGFRNHGYFSTDSQVMLRIDGNLDNPEGCTIDTAINGGIDVDGKVENAGLIISCPPRGLGSDQLHNVGEIIIFGGICHTELLDNDSTSIIKGFGTFVVESPFTNKGKIYATGGGLTVATYDLLSNTGTIGNTTLTSLNVMHIGVLMNVGVPSDMNNFGTIEVNAGGGVTFDCNLVNEPNGVIKLLGGTLAATTITQFADANFSGFGTITGDVVIEPNGLIQLTGPTNIVGDMQIGTGATLEISDGTTLITGYTTNNGTIHMKGGRIIPQGGFTNNGNIIWEPGTYNNIADFNLDGQVNFKDFADFAKVWLWEAKL